MSHSRCRAWAGTSPSQLIGGFVPVDRVRVVLAEDNALVAAELSPDLLVVIDAILDDVVSRGISREELTRAKGSLRGAYLMSYEDVGSRMTRLGMAEIMRGGLTPIDVHLARLEAVTNDEVHRVAQRVFSSQRVL